MKMDGVGRERRTPGHNPIQNEPQSIDHGDQKPQGDDVRMEHQKIDVVDVDREHADADA